MAYTYTPGQDPIYDAYLASATAAQEARRRDLEFSNATTDANAATAIEDIGRGAQVGRKGLRTSALSRGVFRSSVAGQAAADYEGRVQEQVGRVRTGAERAKQGANMSFADQLAQMAADQQVRQAESVTRLRDQADRAAELERQRIAADEQAKRIAEQQQIARIDPGVDFAALQRQTPSAPAAPEIDFSGVDWDALGRLMAGNTAPPAQQRQAPSPVRRPTPPRAPTPSKPIATLKRTGIQ